VTGGARRPLVVDLLRHGAVAADGWAFRGGWSDLPLSDLGWRQMEAVAARLPWAEIDAVAASPMQRCLRPAERFSRAHGVHCRPLEALREMDFGDWEGKGWSELEGRYGEELSAFWRDPIGTRPPGGEPFDEFAERVVAGWRSWVVGGSGHRLLIAHGGVIRVILAHLLRMPHSALWRLDIPYAGWSRVSLLEGHPPRLLSFNPLSVEHSAA